MASERGPMVVPQVVYDGTEAVRQSDVTNEYAVVRQVAPLLDNDEARAWTRDHPDLYSQAVFRD